MCCGTGQDGAGLSNLPEDNSLPGTMTSLVPNVNATMTRLDESCTSHVLQVWISQRVPCDTEVVCLDYTH